MTAAELEALWRDNRGRLARDHRARAPLPTGRPAHLKLELTNFCNLACPSCPHPTMERDVGYMAPELLQRIVDMAAPELEFVYLHHLGESLFHPRLAEMVRRARSRGAAAGLSTNATFLDEARGDALLEGGLDFLVVSLDATTASTYAHMRPAVKTRAGEGFEATVDKIERFLARRGSRGPEVAVQLLVTPRTADEAAAFAARWTRPDAGVFAMLKEPRDWAGQVEGLGLPRRRGPASPCRLLWTELTVLWDGAVVPCANVFERVHLLGDLSVQTLDEVWRSAAAAALRRAHSDGTVAEVPICGRCPGHDFDHADFVATAQLAQRRRTYLSTAPTVRAGLS